MTGFAGLQAVFERFLPDYQAQHPLNPVKQRACWHIEQCRTEALGGLQMHCGSVVLISHNTTPVAIAIVPNARDRHNRKKGQIYL